MNMISTSMTMKGFLPAVLAIMGTSVLYIHSSHDDANDLRASSFPSRKLRPRHQQFINPSFADPKNVVVKQEMEPSFISDVTPEESTVLNELSDINIWGTPAKLTSFGYKWVDDKCSVDETVQPKKKKRAALCLYGGIGTYSNSAMEWGEGLMALMVHTPSNSNSTNNLNNVDWVAALYDRNLLPAGDFELDLFIHSWSETYFCTIARGFDGTRFTVRSIIAEPNDRHRNELFPLVLRATGRSQKRFKSDRFLDFRQLSMYFSINKVLAQALAYSDTCGFEYDLLIAGRPDVLLGERLDFSDKHGKETSLHRALSPHNEVLHPCISRKGGLMNNGDFHYVFNPTNARVFVDRMFPPPEQKWPDLSGLKSGIRAHSGYVQEFARNNGIVMTNDGLGPPHEELVRRIVDPKHFKHLSNPMQYFHQWREKLDFLGLPDHCFPSAADGWQRHIDSNDPQCYPKYYDAQSSCPANVGVTSSFSSRRPFHWNRWNWNWNIPWNWSFPSKTPNSMIPRNWYS